MHNKIFDHRYSLAECYFSIDNIPFARDNFEQCLSIVAKTSLDEDEKESLLIDCKERLLELRKREIDLEAKNQDEVSRDSRPTSTKKVVDVTHLFDKENSIEEENFLKLGKQMSESSSSK